MAEGNHDLIRAIVRRIEQSPERAIPFRDYMEQCLYDPQHGYYMSDRVKIGREGDFYTSSSIGTIMGEVLARYIASQEAAMGHESPFIIVEWGGGSGKLARQLLDELKRLDDGRAYGRMTYISIEKSPRHRELQSSELTGHGDRVLWMTEAQWLQSGPWNDAIVISNELLDAFPVHRVQSLGGRLYELYVGWNERTQSFEEKPCRPIAEGDALYDYIRAQGVSLHEGQQLEVNLHALQWLDRVSGALGSGQIVTIDYGDRVEELYAEHRMLGTIVGYRRHTATGDLFAAPGMQDMTAHVNFSVLIREGERLGLRLKGYMTQKQFLLDNGILELLQDAFGADPFSEAARRNRSIRQLLLSDRMSELFKVLIQQKR